MRPCHCYLHLKDEQTEVKKVKMELLKVKTPGWARWFGSVSVLQTHFLIPIFPASLFGKASPTVPLIRFHERNVMNNINSEYITRRNLRRLLVSPRKHVHSPKVILEVLV